MQDLESLSNKTIVELREIGRVLGIKGALKKQELIDRIISVATKGEEKNSEEVEQVASESGSTQPKRRRGRPARSAQKTESEQQPEDNIEVQPVPAAAPAPTIRIGEHDGIKEIVSPERKMRGRKSKGFKVKTQQQNSTEQSAETENDTATEVVKQVAETMPEPVVAENP